jgi:hypothetical protein
VIRTKTYLKLISHKGTTLRWGESGVVTANGSHIDDEEILVLDYFHNRLWVSHGEEEATFAALEFSNGKLRVVIWDGSTEGKPSQIIDIKT